MPRSSIGKALGFLLILVIGISVLSQVKAITWSINTRQLTSSTFYDGYPALAQTTDKRIWLVWSEEVQGYLKLYYRTSGNLGAAWSEEANLTDLMIEGQDQNPSIMQAKNGTIWVVWTSDRVQPQPPAPDFRLDASPQNVTIPNEGSGNSTIIVTSINNFSEAVNLEILGEPTGVTALLEPSQVVPLPNQTVNSTLTLSVNSTATPGNYTITVLGSSDHLMHIVNVDLEIPVVGGIGQVSIELASSSLSSDQSAIQDYEIYYKTSHDNGATWSRDFQLTNNGVDDLRPAIVQLANGTIMIVFQTYMLDNHDICYRTTIDGTTWSNLAQLTTDASHDKGPSAMKTLDGKIWTVWTSMRAGNYEIFYKIHNESSWSPDTRLTYSAASDIQPAVLQAVNGDVFIFWASDTSGNYDIYYVYSTDNGTTWSTEVPIVASSYEDLWPAVLRIHTTKIWVAWQSNEAEQPNGNWEIYIKSSLAGDINGDGVTNIEDLTIVCMAYGANPSSFHWDPLADLNKDGLVDIRDVRIVSYYLLET